jgi:alcohol dehydrogenase class IV
MRFDFSLSTSILFGPGRLSETGEAGRVFGAKTLVVVGSRAERAVFLLDTLRHAGIGVEIHQVLGEPTVERVEAGAALALETGCAFVTAMGGGSVLDTGKAVAALLTNPGGLLDRLEVIGAGKKLENPAAPFIAIPTTAGTGAEVTSNAVIASAPHRLKVSLRSPLMAPRTAVVDPLCAVTCPPGVTAAAGLDALTQLLEPFTCSTPNAFVDALCRDGMARVRRSLVRAVEQGSDAVAREDMAMAALESGLALANAKLGAVHGLAAPIGGMAAAPHGAVCGRLLPEVMDANIRLLRRHSPGSRALERYTEAARILAGNPSAAAETGALWVRGLVEAFRIPRLSQHGVRPEEFRTIAEKAQRASSMKGNPVELGADDLLEILSRAF